MKTEKIKLSELKSLIKEEWEKKSKAVMLKEKLKDINKKIYELNQEDEDEEDECEDMYEVKAVGKKPDGKNWYQKQLNKPEFEKKGTHLVEEEDDEEDIEIISDEEGIDLDELVAKLAPAIKKEIADQIDSIGIGKKAEDDEEEDKEEEDDEEEDKAKNVKEDSEEEDNEEEDEEEDEVKLIKEDEDDEEEDEAKKTSKSKKLKKEGKNKTKKVAIEEEEEKEEAKKIATKKDKRLNEELKRMKELIG